MIIDGIESGNIFLVVGLALIPLILSMMYARRYNFLHGFVTYVFFGTTFYIVFDTLVEKGANAMVTSVHSVAETLYGLFYELYFSLLTTFNLQNPMLEKGWMIALLFGLVWIVSQIFASILRHIRVSKINRMKRSARRY